MMEGVPSERRVVGFHVDLEVLVQTMLDQEAVDAAGIEVILMLGRLLGLGLDVEPVSYTHLDVYKRQALSPLRSRPSS